MVYTVAISYKSKKDLKPDRSQVLKYFAILSLPLDTAKRNALDEILLNKRIDNDDGQNTHSSHCHTHCSGRDLRQALPCVANV